jgi:hypothetical protein
MADVINEIDEGHTLLVKVRQHGSNKKQKVGPPTVRIARPTSLIAPVPTAASASTLRSSHVTAVL